MPINAYTGVMGSGKTFEVVCQVILAAILAGRRVVTNIDGINEEKIHEYLEKKKGADVSKLGKVLHVKNDDVTTPGFFPDENEPDRKTVVVGGDMVCIDEAWKFWGQGEKISPEHMQFFRMHRHYVHPETKVTCDVALMVQAIGDLNRSLRAVVEMTAVMTKLKTIGMNRSYRVELYEGNRTVKSAKFETFTKTYDKAIFPLYQSFVGGKGNEKAIDGRQNVLMNPRLWIGAVFLLCMLAVSIWGVSSFLGNKGAKSKAPAVPGQAGEVPAGAPGALPGPVAASGAASVLRVAGEVTLKGERYVLLTDSNGRFRLESRAAFVGDGIFLVGTVEGQRVATWTGSHGAQAKPGVLK